MKRLTKRLPNGQPYIDADDTWYTDSKGRLRGEAVEDIAAYEDTGLTPSEVAELRARCEAAEADMDNMAEQGHPCLYCAKSKDCKYDDPDGCFEWRGPQEGAEK